MSSPHFPVGLPVRIGDFPTVYIFRKGVTRTIANVCYLSAGDFHGSWRDTSQFQMNTNPAYTTTGIGSAPDPIPTVVGPVLPVPATRLGRVLHVINGEHYSGAERVQDLLAARLPEIGYEVGFACVKPGKFAEARRSKDTPLYVAPMRSRFDPRTLRTLVSIVKKRWLRYSAAHTPRTALVCNAVSRLTGIPWIYHVHSPVSADSTRLFWNIWNTATERFSLASASHLIAVSQDLGAYMQRAGFTADRLTGVPNGVPLIGLGRSQDLPESPWTLGTVALFRPRKGTEILIEALAKLHQDSVPVRLRAIGGFETKGYESILRSLACKLDVASQIDWVGFAHDVTAELRKLDLFVLPSLFGEGLPMVVLEAMSAGVPTIATKIMGVPQAIRDGVDGLLVEPDNADDLAESIKQVVCGNVAWSDLRQNALDRHRELFSDLSMATGVAQVYGRFLK